MNNSLPAILGGEPVRPNGSPHWPPHSSRIIEAINQALSNNTWGLYHGPAVKSLEKALTEYFEVESAITCASGTLAMEIALRAAQVGGGDEVILSAYDYEPNFLNILHLGAKPVLVDTSAQLPVADFDQLLTAISDRTKAIILSHMHGAIIPVQELRERLNQPIVIIEDAAQVPGGSIGSRKLGSLGDISVISFGGSKLLSAGRGGALLAQSPQLMQRAKLALSRGIQQIAVLSELQATVLLPQLLELDLMTQDRQQKVSLISSEIQNLPGIQLFSNLDSCTIPAYYKVGFWYDSAKFGMPRSLFVQAMHAEGIPFDPGFHALHIGRAKSRYLAGSAGFPNAERAHREIVKLHHPALLGTDASVLEIVSALKKVAQYSTEINTTLGSMCPN
ncbi:MAG: aminotransferase class V-fold PLP-dependent enzyme [Zavarzinella sp.]